MPGSAGVKILEIVSEGTIVKQGDFLVALTTRRCKPSARRRRSTSPAPKPPPRNRKTISRPLPSPARNTNLANSRPSAKNSRGSARCYRERESRGRHRRIQPKGSRAAAIFRVRSYAATSSTSPRARSDLKVAKTKLYALTEFTREKKIKELDAKVKTCEAKLRWTKPNWRSNNRNSTCSTTRSPSAPSPRQSPDKSSTITSTTTCGGAEQKIKQGTVVNEQRVVIRLPDPQRMQVVAKIAESRIDLIKAGMPARIEIEGLPGADLEGRVTKVNEYPAAENWFNANVKQYATTIEVINPPSGLRPA